MRLALASLIVLSGLAPVAMAQTAAMPPATPAAEPAPVAAPAAPAAPPAPADTTAAAAPSEPAAPPAPPPPPPSPTDPAAIGVISALESVCQPLVRGGDINKITKAAGFRRSGDQWVMKQKTYQLTLIPPGSNPGQCHIDVIHPFDPAGPILVGLHNWAAVSRDWSLYRNDKNVETGQEYTTRSWEHDADGKHSALVFTTIRKADGTASKGANDTSEMIYTEIKTAG